MLTQGPLPPVSGTRTHGQPGWENAQDGQKSEKRNWEGPGLGAAETDQQPRLGQAQCGLVSVMVISHACLIPFQMQRRARG